MMPSRRFGTLLAAVTAIAVLAIQGMSPHRFAIAGKPVAGGTTTTTYTLTDLKGFSDGSPINGTANGLGNPNGAGVVEIVGASYRADGHAHVALWEATQEGAALSLTELGAGSGYFHPQAVAVNDGGLVVGINPGFLVRPGTTVLHELPAGHSAYAVNNLGDVACFHSVLHVDAQGNVTTLVDLGDNPGSFNVRDINDERGMAGSQDGIPAIAWLDPNTGAVQVQKLGLLPGTTDGWANALNNLGIVVGECQVDAGNGIYYSHAFLWTTSHGMIALGDLGGGTSAARDINDDGQVVGWAAKSRTSAVAFLWENGKMSDLNVLSGAGTKFALVEANAINDSGHIVGRLRTSGRVSEDHAYLLTPKP